MNKFFINLLIQGGSKFSGFLKHYNILKILGTTYWGDIYKICYNWPNLVKKIMINGPLDFVMIPYLLEGAHQNHHEFLKRNNEIINSVFIALLIIIILFMVYYKSLSHSSILLKKFYPLFFLLVIPMTTQILGSNILQSKQHFTINNFGQILNNITFVLYIIFFHKGLEDVWMGLWLGLIAHNSYYWFIIIKNNYFQWQKVFLPIKIIIDLLKVFLLQFINNLNHIIVNFLGSRLKHPGVLIAMDLPNNIIHSAVGIFTVTISVIMTPNLFQYFAKKNNDHKNFCQQIIIGIMLINFLLSGYIFINANYIILFLMGIKKNINNQLLSIILRWSSGQIFIISLIKLLQKILIMEQQINKSLIIALGSSIMATTFEIIWFPFYPVTALIISQYFFLFIELFSILWILRKNNQWINLWKNAGQYWKEFGKIFILLLINKYLNIFFIKHNYFYSTFFIINGLWGLMVLVILWNNLKIFIVKNKSYN